VLRSTTCRRSGRTTTFLSLGEQSHDPEAVRAGFHLTTRRKGLATEATAVQRRLIFGGHYPELKDRLTELMILRGRLAAHLLAGR
jgi:hypothetical protein